VPHTFEKIKAYWQEQLREGEDIYATQLEIETIRKHLTPDDRLLDIGCGSGAITISLADAVTEVVGADYSEPRLEEARKIASGLDVPPPNLTYVHADITEDSWPTGSFNVVVSARCLINMPDWESQQRVIKAVWSILPQGGRFILLESITQNWDACEGLRDRFGLTPKIIPERNCFLDREKFIPWVTNYFDIITEEGFGLYYFVARLVKPALQKERDMRFDDPLNELAKRISNSLANEDAFSTLNRKSYHSLFVLKKKL